MMARPSLVQIRASSGPAAGEENSHLAGLQPTDSQCYSELVENEVGAKCAK